MAGASPFVVFILPYGLGIPASSQASRAADSGADR
jgi:hypothetical protein